MDNNERLEMLQRAFPGLSENAAVELLNHVHENTYNGDTVLCHEGAIEETFYLIIEGQVAITKWLEFNQEERFLRFSEAGDFFGEMALINDSPRAATVRTTRQTTVLEMGRENFLRLLAANPTMALAMVRTTIARMRANDEMQIRELQQTFEALKKLDKAKLDFIEVAAHELRTPLTVVQGYSKVVELMMPKGQTDLEEAIQGVQDGVKRMLEVVNAMLDVSKIDSQMLKVSAVPVLPKMVVAEAMNQFRKAIQERRITIVENHITSENLPFIYADPVLINKLFVQLLSNAIKYTPDGGTIEITSRETHDSRIGGLGLHISLKDSGVGIKSEQIQNIFEKFYQGGDVALHSSSKTAFMGGGPGLGLAIANGIVQAHKGLIWAESEGYNPDNPTGSTFHVLLPVGGPV
jgi:signal transduction histidine kinase